MFTRDMRRDIGTDIHQARGLTTSQFEQAIVLTQRVQQRIHELRGTLVLTGHSLGGGLAAAAAYATGLGADLYNPSWLSERYSRGTPGQIRSFITMGDELDALRRRVGGKVPGQAIYRPRKPGCGAISHFMAHFHD
jgi:hypothetical protein